MSEIDYRALLVKYIDHVGRCEGTVFISDLWREHSDVLFTDEEWTALEAAADESE